MANWFGVINRTAKKDFDYLQQLALSITCKTQPGIQLRPGIWLGWEVNYQRLRMAYLVSIDIIYEPPPPLHRHAPSYSYENPAAGPGLVDQWRYEPERRQHRDVVFCVSRSCCCLEGASFHCAFTGCYLSVRQLLVVVAD